MTPISPDAERLMNLAQAWVDRAVAVYAGDIPCNVSKYREAFREALFAAFQPDAGAMEDAQRKARALVDQWLLGLGHDERITPLSQLRLIERIAALLRGEN
jgi:hypothetical protein